jgi:PEP-CTERM motif
VNRFDFQLTNTATLNGVSDIKTAACGGVIGSNSCSGTSPTLDAQPAIAPGSTLGRTNNMTTGGEFSFQGPLTGFTGTYSTSDSVINTAELVQLGQPTSTHNIAESLLNTGVNAAGSSQIQSITGLTFTLTIAPGATLDLSFLADPDVESLASGETGSFSAQANLNASFTLAQTSGGAAFVNWAPRGTVTNDCVAAGGPTCTETADSQTLNINTGVTTNTNDRVSWDPNLLTETPFGIHITGLPGGTYTLTLNEVKSTQLARTPLPEPGSLALMGIGLMGLFASIRRKKLS